MSALGKDLKSRAHCWGEVSRFLKTARACPPVQRVPILSTDRPEHARTDFFDIHGSDSHIANTDFRADVRTSPGFEGMSWDRNATHRSGRTNTAPDDPIPRTRCQRRRGSRTSPRAWPILTTSMGTFSSAEACAAAPRHSLPSSPMIRRKRSKVTRSSVDNRRPCQSSNHAWGSG